MPTIRFVQPDGNEVAIEAELGHSLMHVAVNGGVSGIVGECGGSRMCATCHAHVDLSALSDVPPMSTDEDELLDFAATERTANSRLSCQLPVTEEMDGIVVSLPERQT